MHAVALLGADLAGIGRASSSAVTPTRTIDRTRSGKAYVVVFPDGGGFNPGYRVAARNPSYAGIEDVYRRTLHSWEMLKPDIWLARHTEYLEAKRKRAPNEGVNAWVDREGYRQSLRGSVGRSRTKWTPR